MGSIEISPSLTIPRQADAATNSNLPFLSSDPIRVDGQLSTISKEGQANPGNAGNSRTRAMVCELLAIKLLKEYNTRELIDALSYDFFPLQGIAAPSPSTAGNQQKTIPRPAAARISTLEVAIRASAKRFLAHPVVVQQLEAIWAGTIVFHSAADNLHRPHAQRNYLQQPQRGDTQHLVTPGPNVGYGTSPLPQISPDKQPQQQMVMTRRTVTLYDPRDASLFKLSRLRVRDIGSFSRPARWLFFWSSSLPFSLSGLSRSPLLKLCSGFGAQASCWMKW